MSDDGSTDNTRDVVEEASRRDARIRYLSPGKRVGMRENFEYVLSQVKPGYVIALGGDDGLMPDGIAGMCEVLRETGLNLLSWPAPVYSYPGVRGLANGQLSLYHPCKSKIIESQQYLSRQAHDMSYISDIESPMFYVKGVASTTLIDRVRGRSPEGRFYSCPTPDGYSGIVLSGEVPRYAFSGKPFSIYGASSYSQGLAYLSKEDEAKKASETFFQDVSTRPMHAELASQPYSPLITLMTIDYLLTARDLPGWGGKVPPINYKKVLQNGLMELANGFYAEERVCRELKILNKIAEKHNLSKYFRDMVGCSYRKHPRTRYPGSGFDRRTIYMDGRAYNLHNIFDAAYAAQYLWQMCADIRPSTIVQSVFRTLKNRFSGNSNSHRFPPESEWM